MHHRLATLHRTTNASSVSHITDHQLDTLVLRQVLTLATRQIVQHTNGATAREQGIDQIGADETGATSDQDRGISHDGNSAPAGSATLCARRGV